MELMSELSRLDAEKQAGLFAALKLAPLTKLRRLQGRPDPLVVEVLVDGHSPNGLPNVCVCLRHRDGETEAFDLISPRDFGELSVHFELALTDAAGRSWMSSRAADHGMHIGLVDVLHFAPAPARAIEHERLFPLHRSPFAEPMPPGSYTLVVRYRESRHREERAGDDVVIDSAPVSVTVAEL
ncbi:MAG: hypothetical protein ACJA2W_002234 [Planctomycetota bacterium]